MGELKALRGNANLTKKTSGSSILHKEIFNETSPRSPLSTRTNESDSIDLEINGGVNTSLKQLYSNVCDIESSDNSPSKKSFISYGNESRIDSELSLYADAYNGNSFENIKPKKKVRPRLGNTNSVSSLKSKKFPIRKMKPSVTFSTKNETVSNLGESKDGNADTLEPSYIGSYSLMQARESMVLGENPQKALDLALRAMKSFDNCTDEKQSLELVMCLHVVAALYCKLEKYNEAIPLLERAIDIPTIDEGKNHAIAKFAGCMQLGDTYAMSGQIEKSISYYNLGLETQRQIIGDKDAQFGETCRYIAEAHLQLFQFEEAEKLCQLALNTHREKGSSPSLQEAADRQLMGLICDAKGNYESALEHYVLAGIVMSANGHENEVAMIDSSIGDAYLSLGRYDEAILSYQKALTLIKSTKGENHPSAALVFVRLADLHNKIGKFRESKTYCENALRIFSNPYPGVPMEEIASGLVDVSSIYESMKEFAKALELLGDAMKFYENVPGQQSTVAGIGAQMGVLYYLMGKYNDSYNSLKNTISIFREIGEKKSALFGISLNQMGLACVQLYAINEAAELFLEARNVLENEYGPYHTETLGVYSNLAGTYDAMGRSSDAIEILDYVVGLREDKLGTANPDGDDEKRRLTELLKEAGMARHRKSKSLEALLETDYLNLDEDETKEL